jgi:hypothetical protein
MQEIQLLKTAEEDKDWVNKNYERLREKFEKQFIAVKNKEVIANDKDLEKLLEKIRSTGNDPAFVQIEFILEKGIVLIL